MSFTWYIRPYKFVHRLQPEFNLMNIHNRVELLHSRLQCSQGRKALKSKVEVTLGSKDWPTDPTKVSSPSLSYS